MTDSAFELIYFQRLRKILYNLRIPLKGNIPVTKYEYDNVDLAMLLMDGHGSHVYNQVLLTQALNDKVC